MKRLALIAGLTLAVLWPLPAGAARDALGRDIVLDRPPGRIIPLVPSLTEILYFLGLGDRVVGVTQFSSFPPEAALKPKVGSYIDLNIERILTLAPDLVIGTVDGNERAEVEILEQAGIKTFVVNPRNVRQVLETIETLGTLCGVPERAGELSARLAEPGGAGEGKNPRAARTPGFPSNPGSAHHDGQRRHLSPRSAAARRGPQHGRPGADTLSADQHRGGDPAQTRGDPHLLHGKRRPL